MSNFYSDFINKMEELDYEFPCSADQFYHRAEFFVYDPNFVSSDYLDEEEMTPGWQQNLIHYLCERGGIAFT